MVVKSRGLLAAGLALIVALAGCSPDTGPVLPAATLTPVIVVYEKYSIDGLGTLDVPGDWVLTVEERGYAWSPPGRTAERVGVHWADLQPPAEPEAVLLPLGAEVVESSDLALPWAPANARRVRIRVLGTATPAAGGQAPVRAVETYILAVVPQETGRQAIGLYASAADAETLAQLDALLQQMAQSFAPVGGALPTAAPTPGAGSRLVTVTEAGISFEAPAGWEEEQSTDGTVNVTTWRSPADPAQQLGFKWQLVRPPSEPEADLLPDRAQVVAVEAVNLPWVRGNRFQVEVYGEAPKESGEAAPLLAVSRYILLILQRGDSIYAYAFFGTAPTRAQLEPLEPLVEQMLLSAAPLPLENE